MLSIPTFERKTTIVEKITVVMRDVVTVDFGVKDDPRRINTIVGDISHFYDDELDPSLFVKQTEWPEGVVEKEVAIIKAGRNFSDFTQLTEFVDELADFEHLLFPFLTGVPFWANYLCDDQGIWRVTITDPRSLRSDADGNLSVPHFDCRFLFCHFGSRSVDDGWDESTGLLLGCK